MKHIISVDIRLLQNTQFPAYGVSIDWRLREDGSLDDIQALATAIICALGTDRRAGNEDILPDPDATDRRGWWGDYDNEFIWDAWPIGSRLWLFKREKITPAEAQQGPTLVRIEFCIREALHPFLERRIGSQLRVDVNRHGDDRVDVLIRIFRGPALEIELRYQMLWDGIVAIGGGYGIGGQRADFNL